MAASLLDAPWLGWAAVGLFVAALVFREAFVWEGDGRGWLVMLGALGAVASVAYLASLAIG